MLRGGFASGKMLAGGGLRPHERARTNPKRRDRTELNCYFLTEPGLRELTSQLESGCYRVGVPEEGALLTVAWLLAHGDVDGARALLDEIGRFFPQLRFYPIPHAKPLPTGETVLVQELSATVKDLEGARPAPQVERMRESLAVWMPLYDRAIALWAETIVGDRPRLAGNGVQGGWPCQVYPDGWESRVQTLLADSKKLRKQHPLCRRRVDGRNFGKLRALLARETAPCRGVTRSTHVWLRIRFDAKSSSCFADPRYWDFAGVVSGAPIVYSRKE